MLNLLSGVIVTMDHQVNLVFLYPRGVRDPGRIGHHFVYVAAPANASDPLCHVQYGVPFIGLDRLIRVDADQEVIPTCAGLLEKLDMPVMEQISRHVYVHSCQSTTPFTCQALDDGPRTSIGVKLAIWKLFRVLVW